MKSAKGLIAGFWISTVLFTLQMGFTAYAQLRLPQVTAAFHHLGFPAYFRIELSWAKFAGLAILLIPRVPVRLKEWAYAGFAFTLVSALIAHFAVAMMYLRGAGRRVRVCCGRSRTSSSGGCRVPGRRPAPEFQDGRRVACWHLGLVADNRGMGEAAGVYVSIPFCRAKCSFCNFASGVFAGERIDGYVARLEEEMRAMRGWAGGLGVKAPEQVDSIYLGGGTPSLLEPGMVRRVFGEIRGQFAVERGAEMTVECAPGQLSAETLEALQAEGVNRLSFGVQSFVDAECAAVGRTHTGRACREELRRVAAAGVERVGVDLICGLPGQTEASWRYSVEQAVASGVEHVSVYMLEVDEGSRLGREKMLGGVRYGAGLLPEEDCVADWYGAGCAWLEAAGVRQYEISNFARAGGQSRHNRKYWERKEYLGFGLDAHSMLRCGVGGVRWGNCAEMDGYVAGAPAEVEWMGVEAAFEESLFLGLRLVAGISLAELRREFGRRADGLDFDEMVEAGLVGVAGDRVWLTAAGRMASNEVFGRLLVGDAVEVG